MAIIVVSSKQIGNIDHQIVIRKGRSGYAYVQWDASRGQMVSPNDGSGDHDAVFAAGCQDSAIERVAFWCAKSTAYRRRREATQTYADEA